MTPLHPHLDTIERELAALRARLDQVPDGPVIHVRSLGNMANRMIQHMSALALAARVPGARIAGMRLPEWNIDRPEEPVAEPCWRFPSHQVDVAAAADLLGRGSLRSVAILGYAQNIANLLPADRYRRVFDGGPAPFLRTNPDELLVSLRMNEVLSGFYPYYTLLPPAFYRDVVAATGLRPVFFGQLTPSPYLDDLRAAFPGAPFVEGRGPVPDFAVLRAAPNICLSVSTFPWVAAFLGDAQRIVLPVTGLFSPGTCASLGDELDLVPRSDPRYEFWLFPVNFAVPPGELPRTHAALAGRWRRLDAAACTELMAGVGQAPRLLADHLALLDAPWYLAAHPEVAAAVARGDLADAADHYRRHGFGEHRAPFALDAPAYADRYPDAADAVGHGRFRDFHHFHAAVGAALGYRAVPLTPASADAAAPPPR